MPNLSREEQLQKWAPISTFYREIYSTSLNTVTIQNTEYVRITFLGESFLYNQIRKMVSLWIMIVKGMIPYWIAPLAIHSPFRFNIPPAPAEGLLLVDVSEKHPNGKPIDLFKLNEEQAATLKFFKIKVYEEIHSKMDMELIQEYFEYLQIYTIPPDDLANIEKLGAQWKETKLVKQENIARIRYIDKLIKVLFEAKAPRRKGVRIYVPSRDYQADLPNTVKLPVSEFQTTRE